MKKMFEGMVDDVKRALKETPNDPCSLYDLPYVETMVKKLTAVGI